MLHSGAGPFRVAAPLCVNQSSKARLPADVQRTFAGLSYQSAVTVRFTDSPYQIVPIDPKTVCIGH